MTIVYRTAGAWGAGKGANLTPTEVDNNFWDVHGRVDTLETTPPVPAEIDNIVVSGNALTISLDNGDNYGPFELPRVHYNWMAEWLPTTVYYSNDIVSVAGNGIYLIVEDHTSAATFDPLEDLASGGADPSYVLMFDLSYVLSGILPGTHTEIMDDFLGPTFQESGVGQEWWISFEGSGATAAVHDESPEGILKMVSGSADDANDGVSLSLADASNGALVSLGTTYLEVRLTADDWSPNGGCNICVGLASEIAESNEHGLWRVATATVSDGGLSLVNGVGFCLDDDATIQNWIACSTKASSVVTTPVDLGEIAGNVSYQTLRLELDSNGTCKFYIDGILKHTTVGAVATNAVLIPFVSIDSAGAVAANILSIDYIRFNAPRPTGNW